MEVDCWNLNCKYHGLQGCTLEKITIGGSGTCKECDYDSQ